eukprot:SAG22_NODE_1475_length_4330_cov_2.543134_2_plen_330_part_00
MLPAVAVCPPALRLPMALLCGLLLAAPPARSERWVTTLSGPYLMLDSRCSSREVDAAGSGLGIGVVRAVSPLPAQQAAAAAAAQHPHLMLAVGGGGHTREAWEDLAARVFERVLPCQSSRRAPRQSLVQSPPSPLPPRPNVTAHACSADAAPWVVVGAVAPKQASLATPEGCGRLARLAESMLSRWSNRTGLGGGTGTVHLAGGSAGGIAALECAARHDVFASATAFAGFLESAESAGPPQLARLAAALQRKPLRIFVGDADDLFFAMAGEQFGARGGTVVSGRPEIVRVISGAGHELLPDLDMGELCAWMRTLAGAEAAAVPPPSSCQ